MEFEKSTSEVFAENTGKTLGFLFSFFLFTTILYFVFQFFGKLSAWNYLNFIGITLTIIILGALIRRILK